MREFFLIDGYNYLHFLRRSRAGDSSAHGLKSLIAALEKYAASMDGEVLLVLDGTRWKDCVPSSRLLRVHCTEPGETADAYCERLMCGVSESDRRRYLLVSDDRALGLMAMGLGVRWARCEWFAAEMRTNALNPPHGRSGLSAQSGGFNTPFCDL